MDRQILEKLKAYLNGRDELEETATKIGRELKIDQTTVRKYLTQMGVKFKVSESKKKNKAIPVEIDGVIYESILKASKATGIHPNTLHYRFSSEQKEKSKQRYQENKQHHHKINHLAGNRTWARKLLNLAQHRLLVNKNYKNLELTLALDDLEELTKDLDRCMICDQVYDLNIENDISDNQPSLDRIDPSKGYSTDNIRIVCYRCNANHRSDLFRKECGNCKKWTMEHSLYCHRCGDRLEEASFEKNWETWLELKERVLYGEPLSLDRKLKLFNEVKNKDIARGKGNLIPSYKSGLLLVDSFFPNRFKARKANERSYWDWINSEPKMRETIERMTKDQVKIRVGLIPDYIRKVSKYGVARVYNFRPLTARALVARFGKEDGIVYDFSAGFGGRMLGTMIAFDRVNYIGIDPNRETYENLLKLKDFLLNDAKCQGKIEVYCEKSEDFCPRDLVEKVDFAFSSPPYFDLEQYSDDLDQCYRRFPSYPLWKEKYLRATLKNIHQLLKKEGHLAINIKNTNYNLADDLVEIGKEEGLHLVEVLEMELASRKEEGRTEPIFVFQKIP